MENFEFKINPDFYLAHLHQQTAASLAELRNTLRAIDDGSFAQRASAPRPRSVVHFQIGSIHSDQDAVHKACISAFLDLVRALINFIDRMVAVQRCLGQPVQLPSTVTTHADLQKFVGNRLEEAYAKVARDTKLTNPTKLQSLGSTSDFTNKAALSYFSVRRCLEHHGGIAGKDISLWYFKSTIFAGQEEVTTVPFVAKEAANVSIKFDEAECVLQAGNKIELTEYDIEQIFFTIQFIIGPQLLKTVGGP